MSNYEAGTAKHLDPKESRRKLYGFIAGKGGTATIEEIYKFREEQGLYFGPNEDTFDVLFDIRDIFGGKFVPETGVITIPSNSPGVKK